MSSGIYKKCAHCDEKYDVDEFKNREGIIVYTRCVFCRRILDAERQRKHRDKIKTNSINLDSLMKLRRKKIRAVISYIIDHLGTMCCNCGYCKYIKALSIYDISSSNIKDAIEHFVDEPTIDIWEEVLINLDASLVLCANCYIEYKDDIWRPDDEHYEKSYGTINAPIQLILDIDII